MVAKKKDQVPTEKNENAVRPAADQGKFLNSLLMNPRAIKESRARSIHEETMLKYQHVIDIQRTDIKKMNRTLEDMLDLSPDSSFSLKLAVNFDAASFVKEYIELKVKIRQATIVLEEAEAGFKVLFGEGARS